jgi:dipeptidyl aminopeptidase/acylaminoacyl peptidase
MIMWTQKVKPDPGSLDRQRALHVRRGVGRMGRAFAVAAAIGLVAVACTPGTRDGEGATAQQEPSAAELATHPHFLDLETGEATLLPANLAGGDAYVPSPDGTRVAFVGSGTGGVIKIANIDGTGVRTLPSAPEGFVDLTPRWSSDGSRIVFQERFDDDDHVGNLFVYDLSTGEKTQITDLKLKRSWHYDLWPSFSRTVPPDAPDEVIFHMARTSGENRADVWWVPATGGEPRLLLKNAWYLSANPSAASDMEVYIFLLPSPDLASRSIVTGHPCCPNMRQTLVEANESISWPTTFPGGNSIAYQEGESIYVLDIPTREVSEVAAGSTAEWLDNDTLIVAP